MHTTAGAEQFSVACRDLHRIARINSEAVDVCVGLYADQPDEESAAMVADSLAAFVRRGSISDNTTADAGVGRMSVNLRCRLIDQLPPAPVLTRCEKGFGAGSNTGQARLASARPELVVGKLTLPAWGLIGSDVERRLHQHWPPVTQQPAPGWWPASLGSVPVAGIGPPEATSRSTSTDSAIVSHTRLLG